MDLEDYIIEQSHILEKVNPFSLELWILVSMGKKEDVIEGNPWYKGVVSLPFPSFSVVCEKWKRKVVGKTC